MDEEQHSLNPEVSAESAHLMKSLLQRRCKPVPQEQVSSETEMRKINWVSIRDFTVEVGKKEIGEYIKSWEVRPCWLYSLDFLCSTEEEYRTFHHYRARFSTPNARKPIQETASVYFVVDVSKVRPRTLPVEVHFVVESNRLVHTPGTVRFRERWLEDVVESKRLLQRAVDL